MLLKGGPPGLYREHTGTPVIGREGKSSEGGYTTMEYPGWGYGSRPPGKNSWPPRPVPPPARLVLAGFAQSPRGLACSPRARALENSVLSRHQSQGCANLSLCPSRPALMLRAVLDGLKPACAVQPARLNPPCALSSRSQCIKAPTPPSWRRRIAVMLVCASHYCAAWSKACHLG